MVDQNTSAVRPNSLDLNKPGGPFQRWLLQHKLSYVFTAAILGLLALTSKDWLSESWRSLHDDIAMNRSFYMVRSDIAQDTSLLTHISKSIDKMSDRGGCAFGGGIQGIPNPPTLYDNPGCDNYLHERQEQINTSRQSLRMDFELAVHAEIPAGEELTRADKNLKELENRIALAINKTAHAKVTPTSDDPLADIIDIDEDYSNFKKQLDAAHEITLKRAQKRDKQASFYLTMIRYLAGIFFGVAAALSLIGKKYGIDTSIES